MKTFILNGSPHQSGDTVVLFNQMLDVLHGEVKLFSAFYDTINPCVDCRICWTHRICNIEDKMQEIYGAIEDFDHVIIASPIYFCNLTGPLFNILSRLQIYFSQSAQKMPCHGKPKNGVIVLTGGGSGGSETAEATAKMMLQIMNAQHIGTIKSLSTDTLPAAKDLIALQQARMLAAKCNALYQKKLGYPHI